MTVTICLHQKLCKDCGKQITPQAVRCQSCAQNCHAKTNPNTKRDYYEKLFKKD